MAKINFTGRELDIMAVLWQRGPSTVSEVHEALEDELAYKTVLTMLRLLEQKGHVAHKVEGRAHRFYAKVDREKAGAGALHRIIDTIFGGSEEMLVTNMVKARQLTPDQIRRLRRVLRDVSDEEGT